MTSTSTASNSPAPDGFGSSDEAVFAALEARFGDKLGAALNDYLKISDDLCEQLQDAAACAHWMEAARVSGRIREAADDMGFTHVVYAARAFADTAHNQAPAHGIRNSAQTVVFEYERMRLALMARYPDLVAPGAYSIA